MTQPHKADYQQVTECSCEPYEHPLPSHAFTVNSPFFTLNDIHIDATGEDLDINNLLFLEGGSQVWVDKDTDTVWVWNCSRARGREPRPVAYQGFRRPCTCSAEQPLPTKDTDNE